MGQYTRHSLKLRRLQLECLLSPVCVHAAAGCAYASSTPSPSHCLYLPTASIMHECGPARARMREHVLYRGRTVGGSSILLLDTAMVLALPLLVQHAQLISCCGGGGDGGRAWPPHAIWRGADRSRRNSKLVLMSVYKPLGPVDVWILT
jgi:hypothetical protein